MKDMKGMKIIVVIIVVMGFLACGIALAANHDSAGSLEKGKALFNDRNLGTNGKSCNDCHANGKGLDKAGSKDDLPSILNGCITQGLQGKALEVNSPEMKSLVLYVRSFSNAQQHTTRKPAVGC